MAKKRQVIVSTMHWHNDLNGGKATQADVIRRVKGLGGDGVEIRDSYWKDKAGELPEAKKLIGEQGLTTTYFTSAKLFAGSDEERAAVRRDIDDAAALGAPFLRVFLGQPPADDDRAAWDGAREAIRYAESKGIKLALENFAISPGNRLAEIKRALDKLDSPTLGTNLDIGNYAINGEDVVGAARALGPRILGLHWKDNTPQPTSRASTYLGGGALPLAEILAEVDKLPQTVLHGLEFEGGEDPDDRVRKSVAFLRR